MRNFLVVAALASSAAIGGIVTAQINVASVADVYEPITPCSYEYVAVHPVCEPSGDGGPPVVVSYSVRRRGSVASVVAPTLNPDGGVIARVPDKSWDNTEINNPLTTATITGLLSVEVIPVDAANNGLRAGQ